MQDNLFEWHFSVRGPPDSDYAQGVYHGRIVLPAEYPMKPPNLILLTPNGRFETNKKICLSISGYHPETWLPSWSIRTALLALVGFMPTHSAGALGGLECSPEERRRLALRSRDWCCAQCGVKMSEALPPLDSTAGSAERLMAEVKKASSSSPSPSSPSAGSTKSPEAAAKPPSSLLGQSSTAAAAADGADGGGVAGTASDRVLEPTPGPATARPLPPPPPLANATSGTRTRVPGPSSFAALLENGLLWMFVLAALFLALLLRRVFLLNLASQNGQSHR